MITEQHILLSIIMPALNEEDNITEAIDNVMLAFKELYIEGEIIVVDDGSTDATSELIYDTLRRYSNIKIITHDTPKGMGASFWDGVAIAGGNFVCMIPGDNEIIPYEIIRYIRLLTETYKVIPVDMVIPFPINSWVRPRIRRVLSSLFTKIINFTFGTRLYYTNGTVIYRKSILRYFKHKSKGFFYQTEMIIKLLRHKYITFCEVPYRIRYRSDEKSNALSLKNLIEIIKDYLTLVIETTSREEGK